ncbi:MAG: glycosyltransferase family 39 protein [Bacteroidota bacterium]|nr:glycosyltransferase family 39 protein [Bacteroidota bacterium]
MLLIKKNADSRFLCFLGVITLAGFLLRMKGIGSESITADEASALYRLKFSSFSEMIKGGVQPDGHPAFTQVLLWYWTKWFGCSEFAVRFPFVLFGTASVWLSGVISKKWFSTGAALTTAAGMAFLQFPLMYSQLARPYAPGLFFTLLAAYFWTNFVKENTYSKKTIAGFALAAALAAYSHYFSLLTTTLIALAGIFFVSKEIRLRYLAACAIAVLLFLPHLSITLSQIKIGGVGGPGGWLGKPEPRFLIDHLKFAFDGSRGMMGLVLGASALSALMFYKRPGKFQVLTLLLWILPLLIGYIYSHVKNPVLQDSVLLFSFPFLLMFLFSRIPELEAGKPARAFPVAMSIAFLGYVVVYKPFFLTDHFGRTKELVQSAVNWQNRFYAKNVDIIYNVDGAFMIEYNYERLQESPVNVLSTINDGGKELLEFRNMVQNSEAEFFVYGWSTKYSPPEAIAIIRESFPYLVEQKCWYNSAVYCFTKLREIGIRNQNEEVLFHFRNELDWTSDKTVEARRHKIPVVWTEACGIFFMPDSVILKPDTTTSSFSYTWMLGPESNYLLRLDSNCVYSPLLKMKAGDILKNPDNEILFTANMKLQDTAAVAILVIEFQRDGKQLYWNGMESSTQIDPMSDGKFQNVYFGLRLPKDIRSTDTVSFFCYTKDGKPLLLNFLDVKTLKGHPDIYGPRNNLEDN